MKPEQLSIIIALNVGADGALPSEFLMFKQGVTRTMKGDVVYSAKSQKDVQAFATDLARELVIDYEHASLNADTSPDPKMAGEAAGWFTVDARADGLYATNVSWTDDAAARLKARKVRFFSPVVFRDPKTREITGVLNAALTNNPATKGQAPLVASITTEKPMLKLTAALATLLHIPTDANEEAVEKAVAKAAEDRDLLLTATGKGTVAEASASIAVWKKDAEEAPALRTKLADLENKASKGEVLSLINAAKAEGKVSPAQVPLLEKMGARDIAELKEFLAASAPNAAVTKPKQEPAGGTGATVLTAEEKAVATALNVKPEDLLKSKAEVGPFIPVGETKKPADA